MGFEFQNWWQSHQQEEINAKECSQLPSLSYLTYLGELKLKSIPTIFFD